MIARRGGGVVLYLFFSVFLAVGLGILGFGVRSLAKSQQVEGWPKAWGTLLERELVESSDSDGTTYRVEVRYRYAVAGREYESDRIAFGYTGSSAHATHFAIHRKLLDGDTVQVRYNPADPAEAALVYGLHQSTVFLLIFGGVWTIFTLGLFSLFFVSARPDAAMLERLIVQ
jgi:hypothetical protein